MFCANSGSAIIFIIGFQKVFFFGKGPANIYLLAIERERVPVR
jgi:hypothetical protein